MNKEPEKLMLIFSKPEVEEGQKDGFKAAGIGEFKDNLVATVDDILGWFKKFKVESIEITIEAAGKTGEVVSFFVSAEGKGGLKVTLKPT